MKVFAVALRRGDSKWIDSQWISREAADERAAFISDSYNATNTTTLSLGVSIAQFVIEDARCAPETGAAAAHEITPEANA